MSTRPTRSSSIPIPRSASSSSARNIESLISIPFVPPGRNQPTEPRRVSTQDGSRAAVTTTHGAPTSPTRSASLVSSVPRRSTSRTRFEPRVVRNSTAADGDPECPPQLSTSPTHHRRPSFVGVRAAASQRPLIPQHVVARTTPVAFPRPAYLDHSSLRHLLHTEIPILPIPSRRADPSASSRNQAYANALSTPSDNDQDSSPAASPGPLIPVSHEYSFKLPTRWSDQDRHPSLNVSPEGRDLTLQSTPMSGEKDAASARTTHPVPTACGIFYYEVEILGKEAKSHIAIGFSGKSARFAKLPGYEPHSWAYYGTDGTALSLDQTNARFSQSFGTGDIIGCGIDFTTYRVFYTKNGTLLGQVFDNVGRTLQIYPAIGMQHAGDSVRTNFGQEPFKYDIDYHVQQQRNAVWNKILGTSLDRTILRGHPKTGLGSIASITNDSGDQPPLSEEESKQVLNQLVMSYLVHHGYAKTARSFELQYEGRDKKGEAETSGLDGDDDDMDMIGGASKADAIENDIETRTSIVNHVLSGEVDSAIDTLLKHHPAVLQVDKQLIFFKLRFRKFVELILITTELKKKMRAIKEREAQRRKEAEPQPPPPQDSWLDDEMGMDIDEDAPAALKPERTLSTHSNSSGFGHDPYSDPELQAINVQYEEALNTAIAYGQTLSHDYHSDARPELQQLFRKTFGIVAWEDPLEEGSPMADIAGQQSRIALAHEINQAILKSQGRPARPPLETLYRHTATCVTQLGVSTSGVGSAAFADMQREFLQ